MGPTPQYLMTTDPSAVDYHQYFAMGQPNGISTAGTPIGIQQPPNGPGVFMMVVHQGT